MQDAVLLLSRAAASAATVLVRGESGAGKELAARALHRHSAPDNRNLRRRQLRPLRRHLPVRTPQTRARHPRAGQASSSRCRSH